MTLVESLPARPLEASELTSLNLADAFELVVAVESDGPARGVLAATESWVKGLAFGDGGWTVVETVEIGGDTERIDGLRTCEAAVRAFHDSGKGE